MHQCYTPEETSPTRETANSVSMKSLPFRPAKTALGQLLFRNDR
jgi:hypothetical protein